MVILGLPTYDGRIRVELHDFLREAGDRAVVVPVVHRPTHIARNILVHQSIQTKRHLIMCDDDTIPPPGAFNVLFDSINREVCAVGLPYRSKFGQLCVFEQPPSLKEVEHNTGITLVDNIGTGCIGYNYQVWDSIPYPWYDYDLNYTKCSEDYVCHRKLKHPIYCCWDYWAAHVITKAMIKDRSLTDFEKALVMEGL